ncbi:MAG: hypothetical protein NTV95_01615 [Candidatus Saccharibacteria bacterium]|nr:hypothetical protein [Candidatus Saccharibacteria bacterium]
MSSEFDGNTGWMNGPDGEITSGSNQNQAYFPPKEERDQEMPHDMYGDYDPTDDLDLFNSDDLEEEPEDDDMDNVVGIHNIEGEATEIAAAKRRHPGQWKGPIRGDSELDTGKPLDDIVTKDLGLSRDHSTRPSVINKPLSNAGPIPGDESGPTTDGRHAVEYPDVEHKAAAAKNGPAAHEAITAGSDPNDTEAQSTNDSTKLTPEQKEISLRGVQAAKNALPSNVIPLKPKQPKRP